MYKEVNAIIDNIDINIEMNMLFITLWLNYGHRGRAVHHIVHNPRDEFRGDGAAFLYDLFKVLEVEKFPELWNKAIRVRQRDNIIYAIGNIIKDKWLNIIESEEPLIETAFERI